MLRAAGTSSGDDEWWQVGAALGPRSERCFQLSFLGGWRKKRPQLPSFLQASPPLQRPLMTGRRVQPTGHTKRWPSFLMSHSPGISLVGRWAGTICSQRKSPDRAVRGTVPSATPPRLESTQPLGMTEVLSGGHGDRAQGTFSCPLLGLSTPPYHLPGECLQEHQLELRQNVCGCRSQQSGDSWNQRLLHQQVWGS